MHSSVTASVRASLRACACVRVRVPVRVCARSPVTPENDLHGPWARRLRASSAVGRQRRHERGRVPAALRTVRRVCTDICAGTYRKTTASHK